jgi:hypothetical protein
MISLTYDGSTGALCGSVAVDIVSQLKLHNLEATQSSSFRFHMATTLGGAILILATLLSRPLSPIGLQDKQPIYAEAFQEGVRMLRDLSKYLQAARRIANDLKDIIQVVTSILDQPSPLEQQEGFISYVPANMDGLFQYGGVDIVQQAALPEELLWDFSDGAGGSMFHYDAINSLDSWDYDLQPVANDYSVAWI